MRELRYAVRTFRRTPGFAAIAILTIALGIGAATTIFSVVYGVLLRPLPYRDPDRLILVDVWEKYAGRDNRAHGSLADLPAWQELTRTFDAVALVHADVQALTTGVASEAVQVDVVTAGFFDLIGGRLAIGRSFLPADEAQPVAVISHRLWQRTYGGTPDVLARPLALNGQTYAIVGVADDAFRAYDPSADVYLTAGFAQVFRPELARSGGFDPIVRLKPRATLARAQSETDALVRALVARSARPDRNIRAAVVPLRNRIVGDVGPALLMLLAGVTLVLVIACANVANLLLTRNLSRARDTAVRRALGASRGQLLRQSIAESVVLSAAGAAIGALVALWSSAAIVSWQPIGLPRADAIRLDAPVLLFAASIAFLTSLVVGILPALAAPATTDAMKGSLAATMSPRTRRLRTALVVAEMALAFVLLVGGALLGRSFIRLIRTDVGVPTDHIAAVQVNLSFGRRLTEDQQRLVVDRLVARVGALPGIVRAAAGTGVPPMRSTIQITMRRDPDAGRPDDYLVTAAAVTPQFFSALRVPLVRGRFFTENDDAAHRQVVIMTAGTARDLLGDGDPIGRAITLPTTHGGADMTVVGVVGDVKYGGLATAAGGSVYRPFAQQTWSTLFVVARTAGGPAASLPALRRAIGEVDRGVVIGPANTIDGLIGEAAAQPRLRAVTLVALAGLAVALASVGLSAVVAYSVSQRTVEIGIRMALGAGRRDVVGLVVREGMGMAAAGIGVGFVVSLAGSRMLESILYGVAPTDAVSFAGSAAGLFGAMLAATYIPARRAAHVDPIIALRNE